MLNPPYQPVNTTLSRATSPSIRADVSDEDRSRVPRRPLPSSHNATDQEVYLPSLIYRPGAQVLIDVLGSRVVSCGWQQTSLPKACVGTSIVLDVLIHEAGFLDGIARRQGEARPAWESDRSTRPASSGRHRYRPCGVPTTNPGSRPFSRPRPMTSRCVDLRGRTRGRSPVR